MNADIASSRDIYSAYASGALDKALQLLVETRARLRPKLGNALISAEVIAGVMLEAERPAPMSFKACERALDLIESLDDKSELQVKAANAAGKALDELIQLPEPVRDHAYRAASYSGWKFAGPGLKMMKLDIESDAEVELIRIEPGYGSPRHSHTGNEYTLVLSGGFTDEFGSYGPGDMSVAGPDTEHKPVADPGEVCFALAVREGDLKFAGALGVIQRLLG